MDPASPRMATRLVPALATALARCSLNVSPGSSHRPRYYSALVKAGTVTPGSRRGLSSGVMSALGLIKCRSLYLTGVKTETWRVAQASTLVHAVCSLPSVSHSIWPAAAVATLLIYLNTVVSPSEQAATRHAL